MKDLIAALTIFLKYLIEEEYAYNYPTHCEHDVMYVPGVNPDRVTLEDRAKLEELGFYASEETEGFYSYRFGSC